MDIGQTMKNENSVINGDVESVAIIGIGFRLPGNSNNLNLFYNNLENKFDGISDATSGEFPRWSKNHCEIGEIKSNNLGMVDIGHWKEFDPLFFGLNPTDIPLVDPQQRLTLKCTYEALEDAMIDPIKLRGTNTSVFIGCSTLDYQNGLYDNISGGNGSHNNFISNMHSISNRISYCFDFRGTSLTLDTACSSSGNAIHLGYESILNGKSDYSIVGGTNLIVDPNGLNKTETYLKMLGASGRCNAFSSDADGFVRAEGAGVFILKRLSLAIKDGDSIYCVIKGTNSNEDGAFNKSNFFAPSKDSQSENIKLALKSANLNASDINYIETHGTGTPVGDPIETEAISMALCQNRSNSSPLLIGSVKTNLGHLEAASAVPSLAKCCLMFKHRQFLPNRSLINPNPNIKFDEWKLKVVTDSIPFSAINKTDKNKPIMMALNNFGVTGSNVCLLLSEYIDNNNKSNMLVQAQQTQQQYLIPFSANSKISLDKYRKEITLLSSTDLEFKNLVLHQIYSKTQFYQRSVIVANNWDQLKTENQLISTSNNKSFNMISPLPSQPPIVFVFSGQGSQYVSMGLELYNTNSLFKEYMDSIDKSLEKYFGYSNIEKLRSIQSDDKKSIHFPVIAQPAIFIIQLSLFKLFKHWGIHPSIIVGHSFGELTAALCSEMISFETACLLVYKRATLQNLTIGSGKMLSINIGENEFIENYQKQQYPTIEIACFNSPSSIVIAGNEQQLIEISNSLKSKGVFSAFLGTDSSFHTSSQDAIKDQMIDTTGDFINHQPSIPTFSTVTGELFSTVSLPYDVNYFYDNVRMPVQFTLAIQNIFNFIQNQDLGTNPIFLELSPHPTLAYYIKQMIPKDSSYFNSSGESSISVITSLNRNKIDNEEINKTISQIYCNGYNVDFKSQFNHIDENQIKSYKLKFNNNLLPTYQWDEEEYWQESESTKKQRIQGPSVGCLGNPNSDSLFRSNTSYIDINKSNWSYLKGHQVSNGKYYFPGTGYIDNLINMLPSQDFNIQYLEFKVPFIFIEGQIGCLHSNVFQTSKTEYKSNFSIKDNKTNQWVLSSTGKLQLINSITSSTTIGKKYDIRELKSKCNYTTVLKSELYENIKAKSGLSYSGSFQRVEECSFGEGCSFVKVSLQNPLINLNDINTFFNPSILDCCLHGCIALCGGDYSQLVFDRVEDYKVYQSNIPKDKTGTTHVYVYSKFIGKIGDSYHSSATIMLEDGTVLIQADKLVVTSLIPILDQSKIENPTNQLYSFYLQSKDSILEKPQEFSISPDSHFKFKSTNLIENIIINSIKPILNEKMVFRILDLSFSNLIQNKLIDGINSLLDNQENYEIDIEYTITHSSSKQSLKQVKENLSNGFNGSLLFKEININQIIDGLKPSYYDIIIYFDQVDNSLIFNEIYKVLSPKGYFILNNSSTTNSKELLINTGYETVVVSNDKDFYHCQKPSIFNDNKPKEQQVSSSSIYDQVLIFKDLEIDSNNNLNNLLIKHYSKNNVDIKVISNINEFENLISNNSLIYFTKTLNELNMNNFQQVTMDYINMGQILIKNGFTGCKLILLSSYSCSGSNNAKYYLNSSVLGAFKYFSEFPALNLYSLDFDDESIQLSGDKIINNIELLSLYDNHNQKEFIIRNNIVYHERVKRESNIIKKYKSTSFIDITNNKDGGISDNLLVKLNPNLEYELASKEESIENDYVEIKVMAVGINFKDNLIYRGLVPPELRNSKGDANNPEFGIECSGIITRVGENVCEFKVGDSVFAMTPNSASSHCLSHVNRVCHKPSNISFVEAASMVTVFATCLHSIFNIGHLDIEGNESILIHSATGGVGLAALELLKWKGFKSNLFVTVGSKEKEQFLLDNYGSMITKIYSTRNTDYSNEIKSNYGGVDLILNTLGIEFMDSNFKCLSSSCGRIIDLSVTYLNSNEYTDFNKYKYNIGYHAVELTRIPNRMIKKLLVQISNAFSNQEIKLIPIKEYSIDKIKDAIEFINERKHIGKIVVNLNNINELIISNLLSSSSNESIVKSNYSINENVLGQTVLVTGQTGLILEIIKWIIKYSTTVKDIIILSRSTLKWELEYLINQTLANKPNQFKFHFKNLDIGDYKSIENAINEITTIKQVDSIFHFAAAYTTSDPQDVDFKQLELSSSAKSIGAVNLHNISIAKGWKLKQFVMASSMASVFGAPRQCCYIISNNVLDALSNYRKSIGLPSTTVNWGPFETVGVVSKTTAIAKFLEGNGFNSISINTFLGTLDLLLQNTDKQSNAMVVRVNDSITNSGYPFINKIDYFGNSMLQQNNNLSSDEHQESSVKDQIVQRLSDALSIQTSKINFEIRLVDYGADSLIIVQLKNWLDKNFIPNLFTISQLQKMTIGNLIQNVIKALNNNNINNNGKNNNNNNSNNNKNNQTNIGTALDQKYSIEYWKNEIKFDESIKPKLPFSTFDFQVDDLVILLTGVTGFLGAYNLVDFITKSNCKSVYCLVRNRETIDKAMNAIIDNLKYHLLYDKLEQKHFEKIIPVMGDLAEPMFGLDEKLYYSLSKTINLIAHVGADTNFVAPYSETRLTNVVSTVEMIKFACLESKTKKVAYVSTFGVLAFINDIKELQVLPSFEHLNTLTVGYAQSKIISEYIMDEASKRGVPSMVVRPPVVFANPHTGVGNTNDAIQLIIQCSYALKAYPEDLINQWNNAPVDWVSDNMVKIMSNNKCWTNNDFSASAYDPSSHQFTPLSSSNTSTPLMLYNVIGLVTPTVDIIKLMANEYSLKPLKFNEWKIKLDESKQECCIRMNTFHRIFTDQLILSNDFNASEKTIQLFESMGSDFNDSIITLNTLKNHINYNFKLNKN